MHSEVKSYQRYCHQNTKKFGSTTILLLYARHRDVSKILSFVQTTMSLSTFLTADFMQHDSANTFNKKQEAPLRALFKEEEITKLHAKKFQNLCNFFGKGTVCLYNCQNNHQKCLFLWPHHSQMKRWTKEEHRQD